MRFSTSFVFLSLTQLGSVNAKPVENASAVNTTTCNGKTYVYEELAGWGLLASDARDKFGDTIGGIGSSIALEKKSWKKKKGDNEAYEGIIYGLPDRGWNTQGKRHLTNAVSHMTYTS